MKYNNRRYLREDSLGNAVKKASQDLGGDVEIAHEGDIEKALSQALRTNRRANRRHTGEFVSVLLVGQAGTGKTARVKAWCKAQNPPLHLVQKNAQTMDIADLGGLYAPNETKTRAINLPNGAFDELNEPNTVLFLDEFNRANSQVRFTLAQLIDEHKIPDATEKGSYHHFDNLELVVAAINPADFGVYNTEPLDIAELNRFRQVAVKPDKLGTLNYLSGFYKDQMELDKQDGDAQGYKENQGRLRLAQALLGDRDFKFDDDDEVKQAAEKSVSILSPRSFTRALEMSDGTKDDFLDIWNSMCNPDKKPIVTRILSNYYDVEDVDDKANSVFKNGGSAFKKAGSDTWDKIRSAMDNI